MKRIHFILTCAVTVLVLAACQKEELLVPTVDPNTHLPVPQADKTFSTVMIGCEQYYMIIGNNTIDPELGYNELYVSDKSFLNHAVAIAGTGPMRREYQAGRWHMNKLKPNVNPEKYTKACSLEALNESDFEATDVYFYYPLLQGLYLKPAPGAPTPAFTGQPPVADIQRAK